MFRDTLTNKWSIGGIMFLIVFAGACYLWFQHDTAADRKAAAESAELLHQLEIFQKSDTESEMEPTSEDKSITETTSEIVNKDADPSEIQANLAKQTQETENAEEVPISPHGFGPYPEVPDDYIIKPFSWDFYKNDPPAFELMARVRIKLWKQGIRSTGITYTNGLVYPTIPGTVFIKRYNRDGTDFLEIRGSPRDDLEAIRKSLMAGNVPDGIQVRDFDEAGIDPYSFLNIK